MWDKQQKGKRVAGSHAEKKAKKPSRLTRQQKILMAVAVVMAIVLAA